MNEIPLSLFIVMAIISFLSMIVATTKLKNINIACGFISSTFFYLLSKISINGLLVVQFGEISSVDAVVTTSQPIVNLPMSYLFLLMAIISIIVTITNILYEIKYKLEPDLEGELEL